MTIRRENELTSNYDAYFRKKLLDPNFCKEYMNSALEEFDEEGASEQEFLVTLINCIRDIVYAHGGVDQFIAKFKPDLHRTTLYKLFKYADSMDQRNGPEFLTVLKAMKACGTSLKVA